MKKKKKKKKKEIPMKKALAFLALAAAFAPMTTGCASKETTADAKKKLDVAYEQRVGSATKEDMIEDFGNPEWCRPDENTGDETCRFYRKKGTKWMGDKKDRKHIDQYDDVVAQFDTKGVLRSFKAKAQR